MTKTRTQLAAIWSPTAAAAREAGHKPQTPLQAVREKCLDCAVYQPGEVRSLRGREMPAVAFPGREAPVTLGVGKTPPVRGVFRAANGLPRRADRHPNRRRAPSPRRSNEVIGNPNVVGAGDCLFDDTSSSQTFRWINQEDRT